MKCPRCQVENDAGAPFCEDCGARIGVRGGEGDKDRVTMLPAVLKADLARHLEAVRTQHQRDLRQGAGWVELPTALARKYSQYRARMGGGQSPIDTIFGP